MHPNDNDNNDENSPPTVETIETKPPSEGSRLEFLAQVDHGFEHEITMLGVILANSLEAIKSAIVIFSELFEAPGAMSIEALESLRAMFVEALESLRAMLTEALAMIHEVGRRRRARSLEHRSLLYVCCQIIV